ncbi:MAG: hypothetical protein ABFR62_06670 [Bacteroidota bacterium]
MKTLAAILAVTLFTILPLQADPTYNNSTLLEEISLNFDDLQYENELKQVELAESEKIILDYIPCCVWHDEETDLYYYVYINEPEVLNIPNHYYIEELEFANLDM